MEAETSLENYLKKQRTTQEAFADQLGVSQGLVHQWIKWLKTGGEHGTRITAERARQIEAATACEIRAAQLRPDLFPDDPAPRQANA